MITLPRWIQIKYDCMSNMCSSDTTYLPTRLSMFLPSGSYLSSKLKLTNNNQTYIFIYDLVYGFSFLKSFCIFLLYGGQKKNRCYGKKCFVLLLLTYSRSTIFSWTQKYSVIWLIIMVANFFINWLLKLSFTTTIKDKLIGYCWHMYWVTASTLIKVNLAS